MGEPISGSRVRVRADNTNYQIQDARHDKQDAYLYSKTIRYSGTWTGDHVITSSTLSGEATQLLETRTDGRVNSTIRAGGSALVSADGDLESSGLIQAGYSGTVADRVSFGDTIAAVDPVVFDASLNSGPGTDTAVTPDRGNSGSTQISAPGDTNAATASAANPATSLVSRARAALLSGVTATGLALSSAAGGGGAWPHLLLGSCHGRKPFFCNRYRCERRRSVFVHGKHL